MYGAAHAHREAAPRGVPLPACAVQVPVPRVPLLRAAPLRPHPRRPQLPRLRGQVRQVRVAGVAAPEQAVQGAPGPGGPARVPATQRRGHSLGPVVVGGLPWPAPCGQPVAGVQAEGVRCRQTRLPLAVGIRLGALHAQLGGAIPY